MKAIPVATLVLGFVLSTGVLGVHGDVLSAEFVKFHNSRSDVTWKVNFWPTIFSFVLILNYSDTPLCFEASCVNKD